MSLNKILRLTSLDLVFIKIQRDDFICILKYVGITD